MRVFAILLMVFALGACSTSRSAVERQSFLIQPERAGEAGETPTAVGLRIGRVDVAPPFDSRAFIYRRDDVRYQSDFYNQFATDPAVMLAESVISWLTKSGLFRQVLPATSTALAGYRLESDVTAMYIDFRTEPPAAVLNVRWQVLREGDRSSLLNLEGAHRAPLAERSPAAAARAYGKALEEALARLESALAKAGIN